MRKTRKYYGVLKCFIYLLIIVVSIAVVCVCAAYGYANALINPIPADNGKENTAIISALQNGEDTTPFNRTEKEIAAIIEAKNELSEPLGFTNVKDMSVEDVERLLKESAEVNRNSDGEDLSSVLLLCTNKSGTEIMMTILLSLDNVHNRICMTMFPSYVLVYDKDLGPVRLSEVFLHSGTEGVSKDLGYMLGTDIGHYMTTNSVSASELLLMLDRELGYELILKKSGFEIKSSEKEITFQSLENALRDMLSLTKADLNLRDFLCFGEDVLKVYKGGFKLIQPSSIAGTECVSFGNKTAVKTNFIVIRSLLG